MSAFNSIESAPTGTDMTMSARLLLALGNWIGFDGFVLGVIRVPSGKVMASNSSTLVARVRPPSKVKYGALPLMTLRVTWVVNAWLLKAEDNKKIDDNTGTIRQGKFDRRGDLAAFFDPKDRRKNKNRGGNEPLYLLLAIFKL
jgi:hypothetical protein